MISLSNAFVSFSLVETRTYAWKEPGIGRNLIYMIATGAICFAILLIIEYRVFEGIGYWISGFFQRSPPSAAEGEIDVDVDNEKKRVKRMTTADLETNNLVLQSLSRYYGKFLAVNQLSIAVQGYVKTSTLQNKIHPI